MAHEEAPLDRTRALGMLLAFEREIRQCASLQELGFLMVNDTRRLVTHQQAVLALHPRGTTWQPGFFSGVATPDPHAPFNLWLGRALSHWAGQSPAATPWIIPPDALPADLSAVGHEWLMEHLLWCPLPGAAGQPLGVLLLARATPWLDVELPMLEHLAGAYAFAWERLSGGPKSGLRKHLAEAFSLRRQRLLIILALAGLLFLPVRLSVLAAAAIIPVAPLVVSPPLEGVVRTFHVTPNQEVKSGQPLFSLDDTILKSQREVALKTLAVERAESLQAARKGFQDDKSKAEFAILEARADLRQAEAQFATEQLERTTVRAERDGVAIFADANDWIGHPVRVGERVMLLADPNLVEVEAWVPVDDAIVLKPGNPVRMFLNVAPATPLAAVIHQTAYEAEESPERLLAFRIKARLDEQTTPLPRIGMKGTAKVYGEEVPLYYYLFRRPLATLRQWLGF